MYSGDTMAFSATSQNERCMRPTHKAGAMRKRRVIGGSLPLCPLQFFVLFFSLQVLSSNCQSDTTATFIPIPIIFFIPPPTPTPTTAPPSPSPLQQSTTPPSQTKAPTPSPTQTAMPTLTPQPTKLPTNWPTHSPTIAPTVSPTISAIPSTTPTAPPSHSPSISPAPSAPPSRSPVPTISSQPSQAPSTAPSESSAPSTRPSLSPSQFPSSFPSTSFPTQSPTPLVERNQTAILSMVIHGMDRMIESRPLSLLTSLHVRNFWRGFGKDRSPFYMKEVSTLLMEERVLEQQETAGYPSPRRLQFQITIAYRLRELDTVGALEQMQVLTGRNLNEDEFFEFIYGWRGMFTMAFEEDSLSYLQALDAELVNNTYWLRMDFEGLQEPGAQQRRVISFSAATVFAAVLIAAAIYFVTKLRQKKALSRRSGSDAPIVGAMVGGNPSENILISESYDDDFQFGRSQHTNPTSLLLPNQSRTDGDIEPPMEVTKQGKYGIPSTAISDVASSVDIGDRSKFVSPSQGTVLSASPSASARNSQADAMSNTMELADEEEPPPDEFSNAGSSTGPPPFVGDFQMEVQSLED